MTNLQIGDVVYLKSGGVAMTVTSVETNGKIHVVWQTKDGTTKYGNYPLETLTKDNPNKPTVTQL